jgi:hypothetical protein
MNFKSCIPILMLLGMFILNSCTETESDEFCNDPGISCTDPNAVIESCCTDTECYWLYNGSKYTCNGTNCDEVYDIIIAACTSASIIDDDISDSDLTIMRSKLQDLTKELLIEARAASGCDF